MSLSSARLTLAAAALLMLATLTGCSPDDVTFSVRNESGGTLHDVKLTYPGEKIPFGPLIGSTISFGTLADSSISAGIRHFDGPGNVTVSYSTEDGHTYSSSSPKVTGNEKGEVKVTIEGSHASFDMNLEESQH
jgi:hypothetical protein